MDASVRTSKHFPRNCSFRRTKPDNMPVLLGETSKPYHIPDVTKLVTSMDNEQLTIQRAIQGDEAAMRSLWTRHAPHIDAVVRRLVGDDLDLAADIAQEVWIQIFRALSQYRGDSQFGTWAHRIAVNRTLNALRKTRRLAKVETDVDEDTAAPDQDPDRSLMMATIETAAAKLSPGARAVFMLHDVEGYT